MSESTKMNPLVSIAAVSVTAASLVAVGVMTGFIPGASKVDSAPPAPAAAPLALAPVEKTVTTPEAPVVATKEVTPEPAKTVDTKAAPAPTPPPKKVVVAETPRGAPRPTVQAPPAPVYPKNAPAPQYPATYDYPSGAVPPAGSAPTASNVPPPGNAPSSYPAETAQPTPSNAYPPRIASSTPAVCNTCGRVEAVNAQQVAGEGSGLGAVLGGVAGAVLGNQVGRGTGRSVATVAGAAGGALAGHQIEKQTKSGRRFEVVVRMDDGSSRLFPYDTEPGFRTGDKVRVLEGRLQYN